MKPVQRFVAMRRRPGAARGFTLVEVLVALAVMALLAVLAWRGVDGMQRTWERTRAYGNEVLALQAGLDQWQTDLDAVLRVALVGGMDYNGRTLRLVRHDRYSVPAAASEDEQIQAGAPWSGGSLRVVAWSVRVVEGRRLWLRWQSPPLTQRAALLEAWRQAGLWGQNPDDALRAREVAIAEVDDSQVYYYRDNAWSSPQSSAGSSAGGTEGSSAQPQPLPDGVRLLLQLTAGQAVNGTLTRDWVSATIGAGG